MRLALLLASAALTLPIAGAAPAQTAAVQQADANVELKTLFHDSGS